MRGREREVKIEKTKREEPQLGLANICGLLLCLTLRNTIVLNLCLMDRETVAALISILNVRHFFSLCSLFISFPSEFATCR